MHDTCFVESDFSHVVFALESVHYSAAEIDEAQSALRQVVQALRCSGASRGTPAQQVAVLAQCVFKVFRFGVTARHGIDDEFTLTTTLRRRVGSCLGLTTLYMCIGDALGLPFEPVLFEGHIGIAHTGLSPPLYIEPVRRGVYFAPEKLRWSLGKSNGCHARLLTKAQFVAVHLSNQAAFLLAKKGRLDDAIFLLECAIELFPDYTSAWINRAGILIQLGESQLAEQSLQRVMALKPGSRYRQIADTMRKYL